MFIYVQTTYWGKAEGLKRMPVVCVESMHVALVTLVPEKCSNMF